MKLFAKVCILTILSSPGALLAQTDPTIINWMINTDGRKGTSTDTTINSIVSQVDADVLEVWYDNTYIYISAESIPSHTIGPFQMNPNLPAPQGDLWKVYRTPPTTQGGMTLETGLGAIGVFVNGVQMFNWSDGQSYNDLGIWNTNGPAVRFFDDGNGHPSAGGMMGPPPGKSTITYEHTHLRIDDPNHTHTRQAVEGDGPYHYHQQPPLLRQQLGDDGSDHSPIIGFVFDGIPVYGPYGYDDPNDSNSTVVLMESSYALRSITDRTTLPDGTTLSPSEYGPAINDPDYPLGSFYEDYEYVSNSGHLDEFNGRFCVTPEYPGGTYAYFATMDSGGTSTFPYIVGPEYYAPPIGDNLMGTVSIPNGATQYDPTVSTPVPSPTPTPSPSPTPSPTPSPSPSPSPTPTASPSPTPSPSPSPSPTPSPTVGLNENPTEPGIALVLAIKIDEPSTDPDGGDVTYRYTWSSDGDDTPVVHGPTTSLTDSLADGDEGATFDAGERWTVEIIAIDDENMESSAATATFVIESASEITFEGFIVR